MTREIGKYTFRALNNGVRYRTTGEIRKPKKGERYISHYTEPMDGGRAQPVVHLCTNALILGGEYPIVEKVEETA